MVERIENGVNTAADTRPTLSFADIVGGTSVTNPPEVIPHLPTCADERTNATLDEMTKLTIVDDTGAGGGGGGNVQ